MRNKKAPLIKRIPKEIYSQFIQSVTKSNIKIGIVILLAIAIFEGLMLVYELLMDNTEYKVIYIICYVALFVISLSAGIIIKLLKNRVNDSSKLYRIITYAYVITIAIWSIFVSILDLRTINQYVVFLTIYIGLVLILFFKFEVYVAFFSIYYVLFVFFASIFSQGNFIFRDFMITTIFVAIAFISGIQKNQRIASNYLTQLEIEDMNMHLELYNKQLIKDNMQLKESSLIDPLTGLKNRRVLEEDIRNILQQTVDSQEYIGVAMFDIDNFKQVNDIYGHVVGDQCLGMIADVLSEYDDSIFQYRYGGEEFVCIFERYTKNEVLQIMEKIRRKVMKINLNVSPPITLTISGGLYYIKPNDEIDIIHCISRADRALYDAKSAGKNNIKVYLYD